MYIWLILMVNVGKYTVRPMDPGWVMIRVFFWGVFFEDNNCSCDGGSCKKINICFDVFL